MSPGSLIQEGLTGGTNALLEYNYLVKKVVFNIQDPSGSESIFSGICTLFFCCDRTGDLYLYGISAESVCTAAGILQLLHFYADSGNHIYDKCGGCILQRSESDHQYYASGWCMGYPIMWDFNDLGLGGLLANILKLNPVFYIVQGYRDSLINKVAIWEHPVLTLYFWGFTLVVFVLGTRLFKKLQVHFADVL